MLWIEDEVGLLFLWCILWGVFLIEVGWIFFDYVCCIIVSIDQVIEQVCQLVDLSGGVVLVVFYLISRLVGVILVEVFVEYVFQVLFWLVEVFIGQICGWFDEGKIDFGIFYGMGLFQNFGL